MKSHQSSKNKTDTGTNLLPGPGSLLDPLLMEVPGRGKNTEDWSVDELANYFHRRAIDMGGDYGDLFRQHKIDGAVYRRLTESSLQEMGVTKVGDRLRILQELEAMTQLQERHDRDKVYWTGREQRYGNSCDRCWSTSCGCCPGDEDLAEYQITGVELRTSRTEQRRCGPIPLCCWVPSFVDHAINLERVTHTEVVVVPPKTCGHGHDSCCCCCFPITQEQVYVKTDDNVVIILKLPRGEGESVERRILRQSEVLRTSMMERS